MAVSDVRRWPSISGILNKVWAYAHAWWNGYELDLPRIPSSVQNGADETKEWPTKPDSTVSQMIWGQGFLSPGGEELVSEIVKLMDVDETMTLVEIGAGLGGASRCMAKTTGVWVTGLEEIPEFADEGMKQSTGAGMARRAPIRHFDPMCPLDIKDSGAHGVFSREMLFAHPDKLEMLREIRRILRPHGRLALTDYVIMKPNEADSAIDVWSRSEPKQPYPWTLAQYESQLTEMGFVVRIVEDISPKFIQFATAGWQAFSELLEREGVNPELKHYVLEELQLWSGRLQVLTSGCLGIGCVHAYKLDGGKKSQVTSISDLTSGKS